jgi:hypothetical protein
VDLHERLERRQAEKDFYGALAQFHSEMRPIAHNRMKEKVAGTKGGEVTYSWVDLPGIAEVVTPILTKYGLSYTWGDTTMQGQLLTANCILRHIGGHSISSSFTCTIESNAGMSPQQKFGSANAYAQRYSLCAVLGITTTREAGGDEDHDITKVTDMQAGDLESLFDEIASEAGRTPEWKVRQRKRFLASMNGAETFADIRASRYKEAVGILESVRNAPKKDEP